MDVVFFKCALLCMHVLMLNVKQYIYFNKCKIIYLKSNAYKYICKTSWVKCSFGLEMV